MSLLATDHEESKGRGSVRGLEGKEDMEKEGDVENSWLASGP